MKLDMTWGGFVLVGMCVGACGSEAVQPVEDPTGTAGISSGAGGGNVGVAGDSTGAGHGGTQPGSAGSIVAGTAGRGGAAGASGSANAGGGGGISNPGKAAQNCTGPMKGSGVHPNLTPGVWKNLGPPGVETAAYGVIGVTFDPCDLSTLYATVQDNGIWKTTDGGSSWIVLGAPGNDKDVWDNSTDFLDVPFEVAVDPADGQHLYATDGVRGGPAQGFWTSTNGGASWVRPQAFADIAKTSAAVDVTDMAIDPTDFGHILLSSHSWWRGLNNAGVLESKDGGQSWVAHPPQSSWAGGTAGIEFLYDPVSGTGDANTWLWMNNGYWRTTDAGAHWTNGAPTYSGVHGLNVLYRAHNGDLYAGGWNYPARSTDNGVTWSQITDGLPNASYYVVWGDGTNLYTMRSLNYGAQPYPHYAMSKEGDGKHWVDYQPTQTFSDGPIVMKFDAVNGILYSANWKAGILALKVEK